MTAAKIAAGAVTNAKIAASAVDTAELASDAVSTPKLADDAVTAAKIAADAVSTPKLQANSVTQAKIAADAVGTAEIAADAVTFAKLAFSAVAYQAVSVDFDDTFPMNIGAALPAGAHVISAKVLVTTAWDDGELEVGTGGDPDKVMSVVETDAQSSGAKVPRLPGRLRRRPARRRAVGQPRPRAPPSWRSATSSSADRPPGRPAPAATPLPALAV